MARAGSARTAQALTWPDKMDTAGSTDATATYAITVVEGLAMADGGTTEIEDMKRRGKNPAHEDMRALYQGAFRDDGLRAWWSSLPTEQPTIADWRTLKSA